MMSSASSLFQNTTHKVQLKLKECIVEVSLSMEKELI